MTYIFSKWANMPCLFKLASTSCYMLYAIQSQVPLLVCLSILCLLILSSSMSVLCHTVDRCSGSHLVLQDYFISLSKMTKFSKSSLVYILFLLIEIMLCFYFYFLQESFCSRK